MRKVIGLLAILKLVAVFNGELEKPLIKPMSTGLVCLSPVHIISSSGSTGSSLNTASISTWPI